MAEIELAADPDPAAIARVEAILRAANAKPVQAGEGIAGGVDAAYRTWVMPTGAQVELWSDNYSALSVRGEAGLVDEIAREFAAGGEHG